MNWEAIGAIGEIVGAIAVLITLIFLAIQLRQNSRTINENMKVVKAQTKQMSTVLYSEFTTTLLENPELAMVFQRGNLPSGIEGEFDESSRRQFHALMVRAMFIFNDDHFRFANQITPDSEWEDTLRILTASYLEKPGFRYWWKNGTVPGPAGRDYFGSRFREFVDSELEKICANDT